MQNIKYLLFDWGDTLMVDYPQYKGSMANWEKVSPMPGVLETMPVLHSIFNCVVLSNAGDSDSAGMKQAFERIGLEQYFSQFLTSKELGAAKPDTKFFEKALQMLNASAYEACMIGNDYDKDIVGAKNANLSTILITTLAGNYPCADYIVPSFGELGSVLGVFR